MGHAAAGPLVYTANVDHRSGALYTYTHIYTHMHIQICDDQLLVEIRDYLAARSVPYSLSLQQTNFGGHTGSWIITLDPPSSLATLLRLKWSCDQVQVYG